MKYSNYLSSIDHVYWYPLITLILFLVVFLGMAFYVFKTNASDMDERAKIPLN